uniref:Uncharacterized protein n=1 Tax=Spongospora subterranea TaxID=70186 RepID=A0A0H5RGJ6_9EUKA|eukprot:CRZ12687.1 hypothetical protein [Spongospora subterranea]
MSRVLVISTATSYFAAPSQPATTAIESTHDSENTTDVAIMMPPRRQCLGGMPPHPELLRLYEKYGAPQPDLVFKSGIGRMTVHSIGCTGKPLQSLKVVIACNAKTFLHHVLSAKNSNVWTTCRLQDWQLGDLPSSTLQFVSKSAAQILLLPEQS